MLVIPNWRLTLAAAVLGCLAAASARAQTITVSPTLFGQADCNDQRAITVTWNFGSTFASQAVTALLTTTSDCNAATGAPALTPVQTQSGSLTLHPADFLFAQTQKDCNATVTSGAPATVYICLKAGTGTPLSTTEKFALQPPVPPTAIVVTEGDRHLKLSWSQGDSTDSIATYSVYAVALTVAPDAGTGSDAGDTSGAFGDPVLTKITSMSTDVQSIGNVALQNGTTYALALSATDTFGNVSDLSDPAFGTPKPIDDFYQHYRDAGGSALGGGGCATLGGAGWLVALLGALLLWRRSRRAGSLLLLLALALPAAARAESDGTKILAPDERPPRRLLVAVKLDRYDPQVDSESGLVAAGAHPYHDVFHGRAPPRVQVEVGFEALHFFGSFIAGVTAGYWQNIGHGVNHLDQTPSGDTALLDVLPFGVVGTYRFDWAADTFRVPLIPYAQLGLQAALWAAYNGRGQVTTRAGDASPGPGGRGSGWTTGYTTALGLAVPLDVLDPSLAREAYVDAHLQRTSLFAEYGWTHLSSFGKGGALILSDRAWRFGLSLEF